MAHHKTLILKIFIFTLLTFLFWLKGIIYLDPDFGWHLKLGELILTSGFPKSDPFSYSMPSYEYANHEWLIEVIIVKLYPFLGIPGLSLIFATAASAALFILLPPSLPPYQLSLLFFAGSTLLSFAGIRPQVISWLLFSIVLLITKQKPSRQILFLPLIFLIWANMHAGFIAGLLVLFLLFIHKSLASKRIDISYFLLFVLSLLLTLLNPYGIKLWQEIFSIISDFTLRWAISEWLPMFPTKDNLFLWIWLIFTSLILKYFKRLTFFQKSLYLIFLILTLSSSRNFPFYTMISLFIFIDLFNKQQKLTLLFKKASILIFFLFLAISFARIYSIFNTEDKQDFAYPQRAVNFIKHSQTKGRIFNFYGWGGYLIWQLPEKKVFIDGRMASWRQKPKIGESDYVFKEYLDVTLYFTNLDKFFEKYSISLVLWQSDDTAFIQKVEKLDWKKIYQDEIAVIYQSPK